MRITNNGTTRAAFTFQGDRYSLAPDEFADFNDEDAEELLAETNKLPDLNAAYGIGGASSAVAALVDGAPAALDTLKELSDALGEDAEFAETMTAAIAEKRDEAYTAGTPADWLTAPPTTIQEAMDRLAAHVAAGGTGPIT